MTILVCGCAYVKEDSNQYLRFVQARNEHRCLPISARKNGKAYPNYTDASVRVNLHRYTFGVITGFVLVRVLCMSRVAAVRASVPPGTWNIVL